MTYVMKIIVQGAGLRVGRIENTIFTGTWCVHFLWRLDSLE